MSTRKWHNQMTCNSSCLNMVMKHDGSSTLRVVFESGDVWDYQMTDFEEVEEYMGYLTKENLYGSVGAYYHREIKGNFESNKVDVPFDDPTWMAEEDEFFSEIESIEEEEEQRDATRTVQQLDTLVKIGRAHV